MRRLSPLLLALAIGCNPTAPPTVPTNPQATPDGVALTPVSIADLDKAIASHKGKVVVIDCWFLG